MLPIGTCPAAPRDRASSGCAPTLDPIIFRFFNFCQRTDGGVPARNPKKSRLISVSVKPVCRTVGKLVLDKLVAKSDPTSIAFGELAEKYLAEHPFNKQSTRELHTQVPRNLLLPRWSEEIAIEIDPQSLK